MSYVVGSKVKELNKKKGCNTAGDFVDGLNKMLEWHLNEACVRSKENGRKTVRGHDVLASESGSAEGFVVASKVKEFNKKKDCNTAGDFMGALNGLAAWYVEMACKRAEANGRKTVRAADL